MNKTQERVIRVLENMVDLAKSDETYADVFSDHLDEVLDNIQGDDVFGTEGQCDPRGDFRDGNWSMVHVQGVDKRK